METTLERLVTALAHTPRTLRGILEEWDRLDEDLREHYALELEWLLCSVREQVGAHVGAHAGDAAIRNALLRADRASGELAALGDRVERAMGFRPESFLPPGFVDRYGKRSTFSSKPPP